MADVQGAYWPRIASRPFLSLNRNYLEISFYLRGNISWNPLCPNILVRAQKFHSRIGSIGLVFLHVNKHTIHNGTRIYAGH